MPIVVGVNFKKNGKIYYFDPDGIDLHEGDAVIAETARGIEFCRVVLEPREVPEESIVSPLKKIIRKATDEDVAKEQANEEKAKHAMAICQEKIQNHNLPMKLIDAEYNFEGSQITFFFSSESRVDFRELVKDLAGALKTKVQLHQIGVRDEARFFGGIGTCGRPLCCASFLGSFEPVSMKMAKEQSLFLNPLKFSGICGKLMCCLRYEYDIYRDVRDKFPPLGAAVITPKGKGHVVDINVIKETVGVNLDDGGYYCYTKDEIKRSDAPSSPSVVGDSHHHEEACNADTDLSFSDDAINNEQPMETELPEDEAGSPSMEKKGQQKNAAKRRKSAKNNSKGN